ncbi:MAG TPA: hypothetical protein DDZ11_04415 [Lentisphaeria bacterium]|nr:hypothetical protein [Lentisphaeria bacterium]
MNFLIRSLLPAAFFCIPLAAQTPPPPEPVLRNLYFLEKQMKVWNLDKIEPLSRSIRAPFAADSWRASLTRPFDTAPVEGLPDPQGKRNMRNLTELILVARRPGLTPEKVRPHLRWKVAPGEVRKVIAYLGESPEYFWFGQSDILTLHWIRKHIGLGGSASALAEVVAESLNVEDENGFSRKSAMLILPSYGNAAIPFLRRAIGTALAEREPIGPHLLVMKKIGTPEAAAELIRSLHSGSPEAYAALTDAMPGPPYLKEAKEIYFALASRHDALPAAIEAAIQFHWEAELLPVLKKLARRPNSFQEYMILRTTIDQFENKRTDSPELAAMEQIKILLMRSGDLPGSPRILSLSDKALEVKRKLDQEDQRRIQPFEDQLAKSKNTAMAVLAGLILCMTDREVNAPLSKDYRLRVRDAGMRILRRLDNRAVQNALRSLKENAESEDESNYFGSLLVRLSDRYGIYEK